MLACKWSRRWANSYIVGKRSCYSFGPITITDDIWLRLRSRNITKPTEIQEKAMKQVQDGKDVIVNSETGSGKTLCYLLPIIMNLQKSKKYFQDKLISSSRALIFAPTTELLHQIGCVCKDLGVSNIYVAHDRKPFCVDEGTQFIITTPKYLINYDWQRLKNIQCIVFDEADLVFISQLKEVRKLFEFYTGRRIDFSRKERIRRKKRESKRKYTFSQYETIPQFIFAGATMPSGGRKTILSLVQKFVPGAELIQTDMVHKTVSNTKFDFIDMEEDFDVKAAILAGILERELATSGCSLSIGESVRDGMYNPFRAIVYVNKVSDAERLFLVLSDEKSRLNTLSYAASTRNNGNLDVAGPHSDNEFDIKKFIAKWRKRICFLRSDMPSSERISIFEHFSIGLFNVMITTGLAARGIDIPNVNVVVQFDFPLNVADMLHRAGRTGRAGADGKVISFVGEKNQDLYKLFSATIDNNSDVTHLFSRKRRLRRRIKEGKFIDKENSS